MRIEAYTKVQQLYQSQKLSRTQKNKTATQTYRLQAAVRGLKRINEQNSELLNSALEMVEFELNLLQAAKTAPETANYNRGAYNAGDTMGVIDHGFDAKQ